jgi:L-ribulokinase
MNITNDLLIGIDFGSDSVRALLVDAQNGEELAQDVAHYTRWSSGQYCDPSANRFRQHPLDYVECMEMVILSVLAQVPGASIRVCGIGVDTTGSTPVFADKDGTPLSLLPEFAEEPDAMFILWKDHTAIQEAADINALAHSWGGVDYTRYAGGVYSSEWFWAKALHILRTNPLIADAAYTLVEHCDWIPALLTGTQSPEVIKRGRCAAGHKALWHQTYNGYPPADFLSRLHPDLPRFAATLGAQTWTSDTPVGRLTPEWAKRLSLSENVVVAAGAFDAHMGAVGGNIQPGTLLRIMGTSTCDIMIGPKPENPEDERLIAGICGQVDGSVIPGFIGYEAGQSAYGDIFAWWKNVLSWPLQSADRPSHEIAELLDSIEANILSKLDAEAKALPPGGRSAAHGIGVLAVDWLNGRRTPDADQALTGALIGLSLGAEAPDVYRALVEAAAYGSRAIVERFRREGIAIDRVAAIGGVAKKSAFVMQTCADVLGMPIEVSKSEQSCALGAAMLASCAAGIYSSVLDAQKAMASPVEITYYPDAERNSIYNELYKKYLTLGAFVEKITHES